LRIIGIGKPLEERSLQNKNGKFSTQTTPHNINTFSAIFLKINSELGEYLDERLSDPK
jgi:hypothetical protein